MKVQKYLQISLVLMMGVSLLINLILLALYFLTPTKLFDFNQTKIIVDLFFQNKSKDFLISFLIRNVMMVYLGVKISKNILSNKPFKPTVVKGLWIILMCTFTVINTHILNEKSVSLVENEINPQMKDLTFSQDVISEIYSQTHWTIFFVNTLTTLVLLLFIARIVIYVYLFIQPLLNKRVKKHEQQILS